jgi:hypothetical protein
MYNISHINLLFKLCVVLQVVRELAVPAGWEAQDQDLVALLTQETVQVQPLLCQDTTRHVTKLCTQQRRLYSSGLRRIGAGCTCGGTAHTGDRTGWTVCDLCCPHTALYVTRNSARSNCSCREVAAYDTLVLGVDLAAAPASCTCVHLYIQPQHACVDMPVVLLLSSGRPLGAHLLCQQELVRDHSQAHRQDAQHPRAQHTQVSTAGAAP